MPPPSLSVTSSPYLFGATVCALSSYAIFSIIRESVFKTRDPPIVESPLTTLIPRLSPAEIDALPYPPNAIPGARDVSTPYGSIRVYEWGPEDGKKVLFLHGISTPCASLKGVADALVAVAGARVMLIDLFGRGYSSTPTVPLHNLQLYTAQILCAITSSPIPWTGRHNTFTIVGYSLGGGIAATFSSCFPSYVSHVVMLASGGLVRDDRISWKSKILYGTEGILPEPLIRWMVRRRLAAKPQQPTAVVAKKSNNRPARERDGMLEEVGSSSEDKQASPPVFVPPVPLLGEKYPNSTESSITAWQLDNCPGFLPSFISCIRHAPIHHQHDRFRDLGEAFDAFNAQEATRKKKALLVLGNRDPIITEAEIVPDMQGCLGKHNLQVEVLDAGHDVPIQKPNEVAECIAELWKETGW